MPALSFMDIIAVVAPLVSVLALVVALHATYQAARYLRSDILIDVARQREQLERLIQSQDERPLRLRPNLSMTMAFKVSRTEDENKLDQDVQRIGVEFHALRDELARLPMPDGIRSHFGAERVLASLMRLRIRAEALAEAEAMAMAVDACRLKVDAARRNRFARPR